MSKIKKNRVIGARGIGVINGNLNAGFDGRPNTVGNGVYCNSDVSTKFLDKDFWQNSGENVLIKKRVKESKSGELYACTLEQTLKDKLSGLNKDSKDIVSILSDFVDVQNFGATIALTSFNVGITGVCQYTQGINKIKNTQVITHDILAPFKDDKEEKENKAEKDKKKKENGLGLKSNTSTTIGKHVFVDKALYVQSFYVNPNNLNNMIDCFSNGDFIGYKEESYDMFKKAVLCSASLYSTRAKAGCYDEFSIFINLKEDSLFNIPDVGRFIDVLENEDSTVTIDFTKLDFLNNIKDVDSIEIFHNSLTSNIKHSFNKVEIKDLLYCY